LLRQTTQTEQQKMSARNAFTGIGQTTFGQGKIASLGQQGALQEGVVREQYAQQLSALEAQRGILDAAAAALPPREELLRPYLAGYWCKIVALLCKKRPAAMVRFFFPLPENLEFTKAAKARPACAAF
jgi:hypothetical protein